MNRLFSRILIAYTIILSVLLTVLGIVLGQFFPLFANDTELSIQRQYWLFLIVILAFAFILSFLMGARVMRQYAKPIDEMTKTATLIAGGQYMARMPLSSEVVENDLSVAIIKIARTMQEMSTLRVMERERLKTLVESIGSALLMFGREGNVNLVNGIFRQTFGFTDNEVLGKSFHSIGLPTEIEKLIEDVFLTEQVHENHVKLENNGIVSYVKVYGAPVIGDHGNWLGIVVVLHDITELVRLENVRKDFVANVSHELRTPVTSIKGFAETLLDGAMDEPEVKKDFLEIILKESERLQLLIEDLLQLSHMERDEFTLQFAPINLIEVIDDALSVVSGNINRKNMVVDVNGPGRITVEGDASRLIQVMVNLFSNAIAYSKEKTTITISIKAFAEIVQIEVKDQGIGIGELELSRLFERFYRVDRGRSRDSGGTGLGLAIVKHLVEAHSGSVTVESKIGVGTTFRISLPIKQKR